MTLKLTAKIVRDLPGPPKGKTYVIHYDEALRGFGIRITQSGASSFVLNYRANGIERRMTIGTLPVNATMPELDKAITAARKNAEQKKYAAKYDRVDPMAERHADRAAPTVATLTERYLKEHAPKKRTRDQDRIAIERYVLPELRKKRVADIRFADIDALHRKITGDGHPSMANRVVALLSKMFALSVRWGMRPDNPAKGIARNPENRRSRYLTPAELERLSATLAGSKYPSANAIRLLLLTGARRGEVLGATWDQFDLSTGIWVKPSSHTKQKKEHRVPLSGPARQLLVEMHAVAEKEARKAKSEIPAHLFYGAKGEPQQSLKKFWATTCKKAGISGVHVHDLRHTYASVLVSAGHSLPIIGQLLGHTNPGTTARYAHLLDDPLRAATERAAAIIGAASAPKKQAEVIELPRGRGR